MPVERLREDLRQTQSRVRHLLWPFVLLVLLTGWIAIFVQVKAERDAAIQAAINLSQIRAIQLEQHVVNTLHIASLASLQLGHLYLAPSVAGGVQRRTARQRVAEATIEIAGLSGVAITNRSGRIIADSGVGRLLSDTELARLLPPSPAIPEVAVSGPYVLGSPGQKYIAVTRRITAAGEFAGRVVLLLRPNQLLNFPVRTRFGAMDLVSVIDLNGMTLARREGDTFSSGQNLAGRLVMRKQFENPNGTYLGPSSIDGHVRYFSHRRLADFPIFVTAGVSYSEALANTRTRAFYYYGIFGVVSVFGLLLAAWIQRAIAYREQKTSELAEAAHRLREAQRIGKIGDWEYDLRSGTFHWSNELCKMYERSAGQDRITFEELAAYLEPDDFTRFRNLILQAARTGGMLTHEFVVQLPSGERSHRRVTGVASLGADGEVVALHGTDQDMTQSHQLRELERQVAHLDRQGAMNTMAGTLAHELNQPLTAAANYMTAAERAAEKAGGEIGEMAAAGIRLGLEQLHNAAEIIRRARNMVKVERDSTRTASLQLGIASAINVLAASGISGVERIQVECGRNLPDAQISAVQLQQVLVNLLKNALEAVPAEDPRIVVSAGRFGQYKLRVEIADNGPGFPDPSVDAFSSVYTNKESGLGLGLSITRTIIEHHGGKIWIGNSDPGNTSIVFLLPAAAASQAGEALTAAS